MIGRVISHYRILEKLGEGGMGVVYKAQDLKLQRFVALKFLAPDMTRNEDAKRRFIHEARAASALDHENIAVVHEIDETPEGQSFICMAYYEGENLKDRIARAALSIDESFKIAVQIAAGLERAHEADIIHRDIKPANILLTNRGEVKIVDFGLAKLTSEGISTQSGLRAGTAAYMSPEQIQGGQIDQRTDLFSLGVVLYEMLTGKQPFVGEHEAALFYSIAHIDPEPPSKLRSDIPHDLEKIILRLMQKEKSKRYQSAAEVLVDLDNVRKGIKIASRSRLSTTLSALKEKKRLVPALATLLLLIGILIWILIPKETFSLSPSEYVVVADFENQTSNPLFDHSLSEAMKVSLRQSARVNLFPSDRIQDALTRMQKGERQSLPESTALAVAKREQSRVVIAGNITHLGNKYFLTCHIVDAVSGDMVKLLRREAATIERVLPEMDKLCDDIRESLGESIQEISKYAMPLEKVTTPSLEALELYSQGNLYEGAGQYQEAAVLKEQAVAKDSLFTFAISDLSYIHRKLGNDSLALYYHRKVLPLLNRVTDRERFFILTIYYGPSFELDYQKAFQNIQQLVLRYPNSAEGYATLGHLAMYAGNFNTAIEANQKSLAIDSVYAGTIFNNSGYTYALSGRPVEALQYYQMSKRIRPTYYAIDSYMAQAYWIDEQFDSAEHVLKSIIPLVDPKRRILTHSQLFSLYYFRGQLERAENECQSAIEFCRSAKRSGDEAYFHYLYGEIASERKDWKQYAREMEEAERLSISPFVELPLIGISYAKTDRRMDAERLLRKIRSLSSSDPYFVKRQTDFAHLVQGEILLAQKSEAQAIGEFHSIEKLHSADPFYFLAQDGIARCAASASDTSSLATYKSILDRRGEIVMGFVLSMRNGGCWIRNLWPDVYFELGKFYARQRNNAVSEQYLRKVLEYWKDADRQFQKVKDAQELLLQLTKGR